MEVHRTIDVGGRAIGRVVGRGTTDRALFEAIVGSLVAGLAVLAELSDETIGALGCSRRHRGPARGRAGARAAHPAKPHPARPAGDPGLRGRQPLRGRARGRWRLLRRVPGPRPGGPGRDLHRGRDRQGRRGSAPDGLHPSPAPGRRRSPADAGGSARTDEPDPRRRAALRAVHHRAVRDRRAATRDRPAGQCGPRTAAPRPGRRRADQLAGRQRAAPGGLRPAGSRRARSSSWRPAT